MGMGLAFRDEGRAAKMAIALAEAGYGVMWCPDDKPRVVMTSATYEQIQTVSKCTKGSIPNWQRVARIDIGGTTAEKSDHGSE